MMFRTLALAGAAMAALTFAAQAADEQDSEVRTLNLEQLDKAKSGDTDAPAPAAADEQAQPEQSAPMDGQGGPEFQGPPNPDQGMTDEPADDQAAPPPDAEATPADEPADEGAPTPPKPE